MGRLINKIKLFPNNNEKSKEIEELLKTRLELANFEVVEDSRYDLALAIGGDGSFLRMVKNNVFDSETYYVGVNAGTLGFLQEISIDDIDVFIERLNNNDFTDNRISSGSAGLSIYLFTLISIAFCAYSKLSYPLSIIHFISGLFFRIICINSNPDISGSDISTMAISGLIFWQILIASSPHDAGVNG